MSYIQQELYSNMDDIGAILIASLIVVFFVTAMKGYAFAMVLRWFFPGVMPNYWQSLWIGFWLSISAGMIKA